MIAISLVFMPLIWLAIMAIIDALKPAVKLEGQCSEWRMSDASVDDDMRQELINKWAKGLTKIQLACLETGATAPLCGWGYAYQYHDFQPTISMNISMPGEQYSFKVESAEYMPLMIEAVRTIKTSVKHERVVAAKAHRIAKTYNLAAQPVKSLRDTSAPELTLQMAY